MTIDAKKFSDQLTQSLREKTFIKITLGNKRDKKLELKNVSAKLVQLKGGLKLSFLYRYPTNDITKNFDIEDGIQQIGQLMTTDFLNADLFTTSNDIHLSANNNGQLKQVIKPATLSNQDTVQQHDHQKKRLIASTANSYLHALGVTSADGVVKKDKQDKYKQINHYVDIINGIIKQLELTDGFSVIDMGSGKGYLTFALYDHIVNTLHVNASVKGIELRKELVDQCNSIANNAGFENLSFETGSIDNAVVNSTDMLIALHACDTATDDAIFYGIKAGAKAIVCAPCCHKEIRRQMSPDNALKAVTKHGILLERQAEIVTDSIRALLLEINGYKTKVFDFIATEHTPKNVLIVGIKSDTIIDTSRQENLDKLAAIKTLFNIKSQHLEKLMHSL